MFLCYYVALIYDLDRWPFDLERVSYTVLLMSDLHTNYDYLTAIGNWVTITEFDHIAVMRKSHWSCALSRDLCVGRPHKPRELERERESQFNTAGGSEFQVRGVAVLNDRLANYVRQNGTHSSGADDDRVLRALVRSECAGP